MAPIATPALSTASRPEVIMERVCHTRRIAGDSLQRVGVGAQGIEEAPVASERVDRLPRRVAGREAEEAIQRGTEFPDRVCAVRQSPRAGVEYGARAARPRLGLDEHHVANAILELLELPRKSFVHQCAQLARIQREIAWD